MNYKISSDGFEFFTMIYNRYIHMLIFSIKIMILFDWKTVITHKIKLNNNNKILILYTPHNVFSNKVFNYNNMLKSLIIIIMNNDNNNNNNNNNIIHIFI